MATNNRIKTLAGSLGNKHSGCVTSFRYSQRICALYASVNEQGMRE